MANQTYADEFYDKALRAAISSTIISKKGNVCPFAVRLAWHASGTFDNDDAARGALTAGGSDGATMRFEPELADGANAGLALMQDIIAPVQKKFPGLSLADLWTVAGSQAVKLLGGPDVPVRYGRTDATDNATCPPNGRLPDASQGAAHLRDVFYRMGFDDTAIVALSGAHTLGSCHRLRSGFDGPWTTNPLKFDNEYFKNLLELEWKPREWDGPLQYTDPSGKLMMLPTDMALIEDEKFLPIVQAYAKDEQLFFKDFAEAFRYVSALIYVSVFIIDILFALQKLNEMMFLNPFIFSFLFVLFSKLLAKGCPAHVQPGAEPKSTVAAATESQANKDFRDLAMHGSVERLKEIVARVDDVNAKEALSGRTAMHKAAFFGHAHAIEYIVSLSSDGVNMVDADGDTPLHGTSY
jgi:Peroxidase